MLLFQLAAVILLQAVTVSAGVFIGSSTALGVMAIDADMASTSFKDFNEQGNWGTVGWTAGGAILGGASGYFADKNSRIVTGNVNNGYKAPAGGGGVTNSITTGSGKVTFGHGGRHLMDLDISEVEQAIANGVPKLSMGQNYTGNVSIGGINIEYRAYGLSEGVTHVGTYYPKP